MSPVSQQCRVHPRPGTATPRGHVSSLEHPISILVSLILLALHSPWTWHGGTHEMWRFPVPILMSSVLIVPCSPQTWHCGTQEMWKSPWCPISTLMSPILLVPHLP